MRGLLGFAVGAMVVGSLLGMATVRVDAGPRRSGLPPDLRTVVPKHLQVVNDHQREVLRFSNGIANTGDGPWRMRPRFPLGTSGTQDAIQEIVDASGDVVDSELVSQFEFHPEHNP